MSESELELLSKETLIRLILEQAKQLAQLQADFEALKKKLEQSQKPPTNSKNSSQPPSKDQKSSQGKGRKRHKHGPPQGHEKHERQIVVNPDHVINLRVTHCQCCQAELAEDAGYLVKVNQITELPTKSLVNAAGKSSWQNHRLGLKWNEPSALAWKRPWSTIGKSNI